MIILQYEFIREKISYIMSKRVTIMIDDDLDKKIRLIQAKKIQDTNKIVSFSEIINETLRKNLKK
jgi:flagellar motor switch protein FliG